MSINECRYSGLKRAGQLRVLFVGFDEGLQAWLQLLIFFRNHNALASAMNVNEQRLTWELARSGDTFLLQSLYLQHVSVGGPYVAFHFR